MKSLRLLAAAAIAAAASIAHAQGLVEKPYYLSARLGAYSPQSDDLDIAGFATGFAGEVAIGRRFTPFVAAELGIGHFRSSSDTFTDFDPSVGNIDWKLEAAVTPITGTAKLILPAGQLEPYALVGAGVYMLRMKETDRYVDVGGTETYSESDSAFGVHLGAGASLQVAPAASVGIELRYVMASPEIASVPVDLDGIQFLGGATFLF